MSEGELEAMGKNWETIGRGDIYPGMTIRFSYSGKGGKLEGIVDFMNDNEEGMFVNLQGRKHRGKNFYVGNMIDIQMSS